MNIVTIIGARPQFVKAASVSRAMKLAKINEIIIHTGQHFDSAMSDVFFNELKIPMPNYNLGIGGGTHGSNTGKMIESIEGILTSITRVDLVLVYGDTDSTLAGALAAVKLHIPIAHVEAGLRSFNKKMPEEINRILTDHCSLMLFTPTEIATNNLQREGFSNDKIFQVGDVMYDSSLYFIKKAKKPNLIISDNFILATVHRAENTDNVEKLKWIIDLLSDISNTIQVILPLHPRTKKMLEINCLKTDKITIIDPLGYLEMIWLIDNCKHVITDSGGLQKEAFFFNKNCITLREETEWQELIDTGNNVLLPPFTKDSRKIVEERLMSKFIDNYKLYGNGDASNKIAKTIYDRFKR